MMCLLSGIAVKVTTCQEICNRARERPEELPAPTTTTTKDKKKMFEAFPCRGRHEDVNMEKPRLVYDQNE